MPQASSYATDTLDGTDFVLGTTSGGAVKRFDGDEFAKLAVASQTLSGGAVVTSSSQGTKSSGTYTVDPGQCPLQYITNGGAFTLAAPAADGSMVLLVTNNGSAGAITFSGFSVGSNVGDALTTTNTHKFSIHIWRVNSVSGYRIAAHQ